MDTNNLMKIIVSAVIGVVVFAAILVPVIGGATDINGSVTNEGLYNMKEYQTTDTFTAKWEYTKPYQLTVNGETAQLPTSAGTFPYTILGGEDFMVRLLIEGNTKYFQAWLDPASVTVYEAKTSGGGSNMEITLSEGVLTFDNGSGTTKSVTLSASFYCANDDGEFVMKAYNETACVMEDSELVAIGISPINTSGTATADRFCVTGTIEDGFTAVNLPHEITVGDITATYTDSTNTKLVDLLDFSKIEFTVTYDSTETDVTYSQMLVPVEVTGELIIHPGTSEIALLNIIPLLVLVGLVLGAVGAVLSRRD